MPLFARKSRKQPLTTFEYKRTVKGWGELIVQEKERNDENEKEEWVSFEGSSFEENINETYFSWKIVSPRHYTKSSTPSQPLKTQDQNLDDDVEISVLQKVSVKNNEDKTVNNQDILKVQSNEESRDDNLVETEVEATEAQEDYEISDPEREDCPIVQEEEKEKDKEVIIPNLKLMQPDEYSCEMTYTPSNVGSNVPMDEQTVPKNLDSPYAVFNSTTYILNQARTPSRVAEYMAFEEERVKMSSSLNSEDELGIPEPPKDSESEMDSQTSNSYLSSNIDSDDLNVFFSVVGPNFDAQSLSPDEREEIYQKAATAGLSEAVVNEFFNRSAGIHDDDDEVSAFSELSNIPSPPPAESNIPSPPPAEPTNLLNKDSLDHSQTTGNTEDSDNTAYYNLPRKSPQEEDVNFNCTDTLTKYFWSDSQVTGGTLYENIKSKLKKTNTCFDI